MKTLFLALTAALCLLPAHAATLNLDGDLNYDVTQPRCSFQLKGKLQNVGAATGTLKLVLWATPRAFPSPGYVVGEYTLGALSSGYQFSSFTVRCPSDVPVLNGTQYFTVVIAEYTSLGWRNVLAEPAGTRVLRNGEFVGQKKWTIPSAPAVPPIGKIQSGMLFKLNLKATGEMNLFPNGFQDKIALDIKPGNKLESTLRSVKRKASYSQKVKNGRFNKQKVTYSSLTVEYDSQNSTTYSFYYQDTFSGTYKSVETSPSGKETTWGTFKLQ
jgi:hypothetical protein